MIRKPAERAGLDIEEDLVEEILKDAGPDPGVLPLVGFCLETLYCPNAPRHRLTLAAYKDLGRLRGTIGRQANALLENFHITEGAPLDTALSQLFRTLIHVDAAGTATRRRAFREELGTEPPMPQLVEVLVQGRLLVAEEARGRATVALAHEVVIEAWPGLCHWLDRNRVQLQRLHRALMSLESSDRAGKLYGTQILRDMGPAAAEVVPALIAALSDADAKVRQSAVQALGQIGVAAAEAVPALINLPGDPERSVRWSTAETLGQMGLVVVPSLITALGDANEKVRASAVLSYAGDWVTGRSGGVL